MAYEFYWVSGSPNSWRTMLALEYKKIPYVSKRLDPTKGESKTPEYLGLNPRGKVPTLANGDFVVHESVAIMAYLEREFPDPALFGENSSETGLIWQRILEFINYARDPMDDGVSRPLIRGQAGTNADGIRASALQSHAALRWMEGLLTVQPFLAGNQVSAADFTAIPCVQFLARVGKSADAVSLQLGLDDLQSSYPAVSRWIARIEQLPCYERAYPPHWRNSRQPEN